MSTEHQKIQSIDDPKMEELCQRLRELSKTLGPTEWPEQQLQLTEEFGVQHWFVTRELGGLEWSARDLMSAYLKMSAACLTTTFVITQRVAALKRIAASENETFRDELLGKILTGKASATVGISHLTTSRRHVKKPVLIASETETGYLLNGFSPWVTGGCGAAFLVVGAEQEDGSQVLFAIDKSDDSIQIDPGFSLVALTGSQTGAVKFNQTEVDRRYVLAGPVENVLASMKVSTTGGFNTSALALGLASAAIEFIANESERRAELSHSLSSLSDQLESSKQQLFELSDGNPVCTSEELRTNANSLVLRATQAALVAAKGTGFVQGHPVGRWCQEALFFLVWSCPQAVTEANLCELAGIEG